MRIWLAILFAVLLIPASTMVFAHPAPVEDEVIHVCHNTKTGFVMIVEETEDCLASFTALDWNTAGIQGPIGPAGMPGLRHLVTLDNDNPCGGVEPLDVRTLYTVNFTIPTDSKILIQGAINGRSIVNTSGTVQIRPTIDGVVVGENNYCVSMSGFMDGVGVPISIVTDIMAGTHELKFEARSETFARMSITSSTLNVFMIE